MKYIRTREQEREAKKILAQPTIPMEIRKKLLESSKKHAEQNPEGANRYAVDQVEVAATELTEQAVHTTSTVAQNVQPIIREKIVQAGIKERPTAVKSIHHTRDEPTAAVPVEARQEIAAQNAVTVCEQHLQSAHYGQSKAPAPKQDSVSTTVPPKEKPAGGASVPKTKARRPTATQSTPVAVKSVHPKSFFKRSVDAASSTVKQTGETIARASKSMISSLAGLGGGILLIALCVILLLAAVFSSPMGILFSDQSEQPNTVLLNVAIAQINTEYAAKLDELQKGEYESIEIHGAPPDWREVVAVFASKTAGGDQGVDVMTLDADRVDRLRAVFWDMTAIQTEEEDGVLHITINAKTAEDMRFELPQYVRTVQKRLPSRKY